MDNLRGVIEFRLDAAALVAKSKRFQRESRLIGWDTFVRLVPQSAVGYLWTNPAGVNLRAPAGFFCAYARRRTMAEFLLPNAMQLATACSMAIRRPGEVT